MTGVIYFIENGGAAIKIGFSSKVDRRVRNIFSQSSVALKLIGTTPGTRWQEKTLHGLVAEHRIRGEWFSDCTAVRELVHQCLDQGLSFLGEEQPKVSLHPWVSDAQRIARSISKFSILICEGDVTKRLSTVEQRYNIPSSTLWQLCFKPHAIDMGAYVAVLVASRQFFRDLKLSIDKESEFVLSIMDSHREEERKTKKLEIELGLKVLPSLLTQAFAEQPRNEGRA